MAFLDNLLKAYKPRREYPEQIYRTADKKEVIALCADVLVKPFEGYAKRLPNGDCTAYPDPGSGGDPWTIGWGSTGPDIVEGTVWTQERAQKALEAHLSHFYDALVLLSPKLVTEPPRRIAAVLSWVYNCGTGNYRISTFKKRIDAKDWEGAATECLKWNKASGRVLKGLTRRRQAESLMIK
jgi:GH24 family phage-related lysozyme (muramidase)